MKLRKITAAIAAAAVLALTLTGCGNDPDFDNFMQNIPQNGQSSGTPVNPFQSTSVESKPTVQLPDIPVNDAAAFEYKYDSRLGGMVITDYKLQSPKVHIPDILENEKVVKVDFSEVKKDITHIIMPDSVQDFDFSDTIKGAVQFVNIPASVTELQMKNRYNEYKGFFEGCRSLASITIPDSVTKIGDSAFKNCTDLTSIAIGKSVTSIGLNAFKNCTSLTYIDVADGNPKYCSLDGMLCEKNEDGEITLKMCPQGKSGSIVIPDSVTDIGSMAFSSCTGLISITIPDSVSKIVSNAFEGCTSLTSATYKGKTYYYEDIDSLIFDVKLDENGMWIEDGILKGVSRELTKVVIPDSVTEIDTIAFFNCTSLKSVTILDGVTEIGSYSFLDKAFSGCTGLTSIDVSDGNPKYCSLDGMLCEKNEDGGIILYRCPEGKSGNIVIPENVTSIGLEAFKNCTSVTRVTIPDRVTLEVSIVGNAAFDGCKNIQATYKGKTYDYAHIDDLYKAINGN